MRGALALALIMLSGCPVPEDRFVLEGTLVETAGVEVRLFRDASRDGVRCLPMKLLKKTVTDALGHYRFELLRQELSMGSATNHFVRVETSDSESFTFRFPEVDVVLPPMVPGHLVQWLPQFQNVTEYQVDGVLAWRGSAGMPASLEGREVRTRTVARQQGDLSLVSDDFGNHETVELEFRAEQPFGPLFPMGEVPRSRGAACSLDAGICPLTDGRFTPVELAPGTRAIEFTLAQDQVLHQLVLRGLITAAPFSAIKLEWTPDTSNAWAPYVTIPWDPAAELVAARSCDEPGAFIDVALATGYVSPRQLRLHFIDGAGASVDILWLAEVSVW